MHFLCILVHPTRCSHVLRHRRADDDPPAHEPTLNLGFGFHGDLHKDWQGMMFLCTLSANKVNRQHEPS